MFNNKSLILIFLVTLSLAKKSHADAYIRVIDVGLGLCVVGEIDTNKYFVYDAGHWIGRQCLDTVREIVKGQSINVMVLSHSGSDHLGTAANIRDLFDVQNIVRTGNQRTTKTWKKTKIAIH